MRRITQSPFYLGRSTLTFRLDHDPNQHSGKFPGLINVIILGTLDKHAFYKIQQDTYTLIS